MSKKFLFISLILFFSLRHVGLAQVSEIKSASSRHSKSGKSVSGGSSGAESDGGILGDLFVQVFIGGIINVQQVKLQKRHTVPSIISLEAMMQGAVQPSSYYILTPRFRGNWGLFSTDFRFNYLIEEGIDEVTHLRTNDWQILQLNLVTTRDARFRAGGGILQEAYSGKKTFAEWTFGLHIEPFDSRLGGVAEYRTADNRKEGSLYLQCNVTEYGKLHGYLTLGAIHQRYYRNIDVWGIQAGYVLKIF